ncbi:hypothetical protein, conserved [Trypanosoma brucei gambiense DAL972]|uniref:MI domain-containing protein n=1 Tax=Trypanosoma brucei gambiense (strain MHOM/CI/86/DAL972) TaxID=679716 RepID=C9ZQT3_TRYB9|nr:hypothetical protein, conserved [Trypanosoma brucei gambiense DAL972]CBH11763.1 hypothetical protein, conserved [Trypanosoma brucei gambiense DAL972]|eukprot:XP_011774048.1 hypothetical protein, conserved [Trypanosoma brucei gambiense DAL972]
MDVFSRHGNRRRPREDEMEENDYTFDRQRDRKERRRNERRAKKEMRIEAHERWVEQCRLAREQKKKRSVRVKNGSENQAATRNFSNRPLRERKVNRNAKRETSFNDAKEKSTSSQKLTMESKREAKQRDGKSVVDLAKACATTPDSTQGKYIPPSLRQKMIVQKPTNAVNEAARRIINKLTVQNVADMTRETSELFGGGVEGATRASVISSLAENMNRICILDSGPLTPLASLPFAGLIRGLQLLHGNIVGAEVIECLAIALQQQLMDNNEAAACNGAMLLAHLYLLNAVDCVLASTFLRSVLQMGGGGSLCAAAAGLTFLRACGEKLLKEAPVEMERALNEGAPSREISQNATSRYSALLSLIKEIVAGRTRNARRSVDEEKVPLDSLLSDISTLLSGGGKASLSSSGNKRALLRVMSTTSVLTGLSWARLIQQDKPHRWYVPETWTDTVGDGDETNDEHADDDEGGASSASGDIDERSDGDEGTVEKMEQIRLLRQQEKAISGQRLNTENKREVFKCVVNASDDLEAFTLLMHRDPSFSRLHDTFAVLLQCCYQENLYNPYYTQVVQRFCSAKPSCKNTLQFAIWDMFKTIRVEAVDVTGYLNLACLIAQLMQEGVYTLAVLRGLDLENTNRTIGLFTRILLLRLILQLPPSSLTEVFFGGNGVYAHDVKIDTSTLRENLKKVFERYFVKEEDAGKWIPHFYDVAAVGTPFDVHKQMGAVAANASGMESVDEEAQLQSFVRRIRVVYKALKGGIS